MGCFEDDEIQENEFDDAPEGGLYDDFRTLRKFVDGDDQFMQGHQVKKPRGGQRTCCAGSRQNRRRRRWRGDWFCKRNGRYR